VNEHEVEEATPMFTSAFPIVYTTDLTAALRCYRDLLGFELSDRFPAEGEPTFVALRLDASEIGIGQTGDRGDLHGLPIDVSGGTRFELCVYCQDTDAAIAHLREHGVQVLYEPTDQPWSERLASVLDPMGNPVHINAPIG
jgi:lactoylglutathione lyase